MLKLYLKNTFPEVQKHSHRRLVRSWLFSGCVLIYLMVLTGGITRLTNSGLSMVNWNFVLGSLPPLTDADWSVPFNRYKTSPQFILINNNFSLQDFKHIYWWEYWHRFIGRLIGLFFLVPFFIFSRWKIFTAKQFVQGCILLVLGILQGLLGWFMVKSGLSSAPHVSHFRLSMHLGNAFLLFYFTFSFFRHQDVPPLKTGRSGTYAVMLVWMIFLQVVLGALVSGLKAGLIYNTFPLMGNQIIPEELPALLSDPVAAFSSGAAVQFLHRTVALLVILLILKLFYDTRSFAELRGARIFLLCVGLLQFSLGATALLLHVPVLMGVLHQAGAFTLFSASIFFKQKTS